MKNLYLFTLLCCLLQGPLLFAQQRSAKEKVSTTIEDQKKVLKLKAADSTLTENTEAIGRDARSEPEQLKNSIQQDVNELKRSTPANPDLKGAAKENVKALEQKASNLQYDSDKPDDAPWKKEQLSKDDLKGIDLPSTPDKGALPSMDKSKGDEYKDRIGNLKPSSSPQGSGTNDKIPDVKHSVREHQKVQTAQHKSDSLLALKDKVNATDLRQKLSGVRELHSDKYIQKLYDSLGADKADSILNVAAPLAKKVTSREDLIDMINSKTGDKQGPGGLGLDQENQSLTMQDSDKLNGLPDQAKNPDVSALQLPADVLGELPPLSGQLLDSKYIPAIDSMRDVALRAKDVAVNEKEITEELKQTAFKRKPKLWDKFYFDGILGVVSDTAFTIVQISPSLGYHFTDNLSIGAGPIVSVQFAEKNIDAVVGFRSFVKAEFWKQRGYVQFEDNMQRTKVRTESIRAAQHSLLLGVGGLLPVFGRLAINAGIFYRINQEDFRPGGSPWVFRIGLSSVKKLE